MKIIYIPLLTFVSLFIGSSVIAQTSAINNAEKPDKTASFKAGVNYLSNNVFMGRADTVKTSIILPELKYTFNNGIFISGNINYIPNNKRKKLDGGNIVAGYDFDITDDLSGGVSVAKLFYSSSSVQIGSSISSVFNANINYDIAGIITPAVSVDYNIIKNGFSNDVFINGSLSHDFEKKGVFNDKDLFAISPTVAINAGTQNFYDAYVTGRKYKSTAKNQALAAKETALLDQRKEQLSHFDVLDYEFSAPLEYKIGMLILNFTPTYAITKNKLPSAIAAGLVNGNIFYFETGATLKF